MLPSNQAKSDDTESYRMDLAPVVSEDIVQDSNEIVSTYIAGINHHDINKYVQHHVTKHKNSKYGGNTKKELLSLVEDYPKIYKYNKLSSSKVVLEPDTNNQHDSNAVKVLVDGYMLGFIPRTHSEKINNCIKNNEILKVKVFIRGGTYVTLDYDDFTEVDGKYYSDLIIELSQ